MGSTQSYETEVIINVSELTHVDEKCIVKIMYKNTWLSKEPMTITIVAWDCEFTFNIEYVSGKYKITKNETVEVTLADLFENLRGKPNYEKERKNIIEYLPKTILKLKDFANKTTGGILRKYALSITAGSLLQREITKYVFENLVRL